MKHPRKVTVGIPVYNVEKYIVRCLESVINQDYPYIDILIMYDESSDRSLEIAKKALSSSKIKYSVLLNKSGKSSLGIARNLMLKNFVGDYLIFLDSDDFFCKKKIETIVNHFQNNRKDQIIFDLPIEKHSDKIIIKKNKIKYIKNYWPYIPPQSCISIKRKTLEQMYNFVDFEKFHNIWFDFRIAIFAKHILKNFFILEENLTYYRKLDTAVTSNYTFLSKNWWSRRKQAHDFMRMVNKKYKPSFKTKTDFITTYIIEKLYNFL